MPFLLLTVFTTLFFALFSWPGLSDPDLPWHVAAGQWMLQHHVLPAHDPWSFTAGDTPWYNLSWLYDIALGWLYQSHADTGMQLIATALASLLGCILLTHLAARHGKIHAGAGLLVWFVALYMLLPFASARPYIFAFVLCAFAHYILANPDRWQKWWIPILMVMTVLWSNTHGSIPALFILLAVFVIHYHFEHQKKLRDKLIVASVLCAPMVLITPYGVDLPTAIHATTGSFSTHYIAEWTPLSWNSAGIEMVWVLMFILLFSLRDRSLPLSERLLSLIWLIAALKGVRMLGMFVVFSTPFIALSLSKIFQDYRLFQGLNPPELKRFVASPKTALYATAVSALLLMAMLKFSGFGILQAKPENPDIFEIRDVVAWLMEHNPDGRYLNEYSQGGRIILYSGGRIKPMIDGRAETAYPREVLEDNLKLFETKTLSYVARKYQLDGFMARKGTWIHLILEEGIENLPTKKVFEGKDTSVYNIIQR